MSYRVLFSDVGNVIALLVFDGFVKALAEMVGLDVETTSQLLYLEMQGETSVRTDYLKGIHQDILTGAISPERYRRVLEERFDRSLPAEKFWPIFVDIFEPNVRIIALWERLRREGRVERIIMLSDADPHRVMRALEINDFRPDAMVVSYEVGQLKPHEAMFRRALELAQVPPEECIFVDDLADNVAAAREFGIEGVQYLIGSVGAEAATDILIGELRALGLLG